MEILVGLPEQTCSKACLCRVTLTSSSLSQGSQKIRRPHPSKSEIRRHHPSKDEELRKYGPTPLWRA